MVGGLDTGEGERLLIEMLKPSSDARILDLCTGGGHLLAEIAHCLGRRSRLLRIDVRFLDLKRVEGAIKVLGREDQCDFIMGDVRRLPLVSEYIDSAASNVGLDHVEGFTDAVDEAFRILKPGGTFAYVGNTHRTLWGLGEYLTLEQQHTILRRQRVTLRKETTLAAVRRSGFVVEKLHDRTASWDEWYALLARKPG